MKKAVPVIFLLSLCFCLVFGEAIPNNSRIRVEDRTDSRQISDFSLSSLVKSKIESNLIRYTPFFLIDSSNEDSLRKLRAASESAEHDENQMLEAGKVYSATHALLFSVNKAGNSYSITVDIVDGTTNRKIYTRTSNAQQDSLKLWNGPGCETDLLTIDLCSELGIALTGSQIYYLRFGEAETFTADDLEKAREEQASFQEMIAGLDGRIAALKVSSDISADAQIAKIQAERALIEEQYSLSLVDYARLQKEQKKAFEDQKTEMERSFEQKKARDDMAKLAEEKAAEARKLTQANGDAFAKIEIIEKTKGACLDVYTAFENLRTQRKSEMEAEVALKTQEILDRPYRAAEKKADGTPIDEARAVRQAEADQKKAEIMAAYEADAAKIKDTAYPQIVSLYEEVFRLEKEGFQTKVTSFNKDFSYSIENYDGDSKSWIFSWNLLCNGKMINSGSGKLPYEAVTGMKPVEFKSARENFSDYNTYLDTVDLYNSLFARGEPILNFEISYRMTTEHNSGIYVFTCDDLIVNHTVTGKRIAVQKVEKGVIKLPDSKDLTPVIFYLLDAESIEDQNPVYSDYESSDSAYEEYMDFSLISDYRASVDGDFLKALYSESDDYAFSIDFQVNWIGRHNSFFGLSFGGFQEKEKVPPAFAKTGFSDALIHIGFKSRNRSFNWYVSCGIGLAVSDSSITWIDYFGNRRTDDTFLMIRSSLGIDLSLFTSYAGSDYGLFLQGDLNYIEPFGIIPDFSLGWFMKFRQPNFLSL